MLKPDRVANIESNDYFITTTGDAGRVAFQGTGTQAVGNGLDSTNNKIEYVNSIAISGRKAVGIVMNPVVNIDLSRQQLNPYNEEKQVNSKVLVYAVGEVMTNCWGSGQLATSVQVPATVYAGPSGLLYTDNFSGSGWPTVGKALTGKDADGYAKVRVDVAGN